MKQVQFSSAATNKKYDVIAETTDYYILINNPSDWGDDVRVAVLKSAVKVVEDPLYHIGQRFRINEQEYILAQVGLHIVSLISLVTGNRLRDSIKVTKSYEITKYELSLIGTPNITLIE